MKKKKKKRVQIKIPGPPPPLHESTPVKCFRKAGILDNEQSLVSCAPCSDDWDPFEDVDVQLDELIVYTISISK